MRTLSSVAMGMTAALLLGACAPREVETASAPAAPAAVPAPAAMLKLPVSINATMVALVDHASEPLWVDAYVPPTTDEGWQDAEYNAYQIAVGGKLIQIEGTGPNDAAWTTDPTWKANADEMSDAGMQALTAAKAKDAAMLNTAGDRLVAACESCHKAFKPNLPTMGLYKSPNYPRKSE